MQRLNTVTFTPLLTYLNFHANFFPKCCEQSVCVLYASGLYACRINEDTGRNRMNIQSMFTKKNHLSPGQFSFSHVPKCLHNVFAELR